MAEPYLGEIRMFSGNYAPQDWCVCDGRLLNISQNQALFSLLGTTYGGDGITTFGVPDLRGRAVVHQGRSTTGSQFTLGQMAGQETVTLAVAQVPVHTHVVQADPVVAEATGATPTNAFWGSGAANAYSNVAPNAQMAPGLCSAAGGSTPHQNMMPFLVINFILALQGVYPSRP